MPLFRSFPDFQIQPYRHTAIWFPIFLAITIGALFARRWWPARKAPVSVNYHFTRQCNKSCGFCFHTATTSFRLSIAEAKKGLCLLKAAGMRKINFAGGEPFMYPKFLGPMVQFCKKELQLESVSIVTNGSLVKRQFLEQYGQYIDILAVSCDSFDEQTNIDIGRGKGDQVTQLFRIAGWCQEYGIKFKLNTVVCNLNHLEDMNAIIEKLQPFRWKCFQVLLVRGENDSEKTLRDVRMFQITDEQYLEFCRRHEHQPSFVAEPNNLMAKSYLILDEYMRFLDRDGREPSSSILDVDVFTALGQVFWDEESFKQRGGIYDWSRETIQSGCGSSENKALEW
ncbi:hypothetical protein FQN49_005170 [Arthroderma sp. PD_2]|nr:hypothetical protein FQN49_005170 [Arthroderma sp. PD_2]